MRRKALKLRKIIKQRVVTRKFDRRKNKYTGYRPETRYLKMLWEFHLNDDDPWPSVPHGHSIDPHGYKLHVYTGEVFEISTNKLYKQLKNKDLNALWANKRFKQFVARAKHIYQEKDPRFTRRYSSLYRPPILRIMLSVEDISE